MTTHEADDLLLALRAAFATPHWDEATKDLYRSELQRLNVESASTAIKAIIRSATWRPTIAEILTEYRAAERRRLDAIPALGMPDLTSAERIENVRRIHELQQSIGREIPSE